MSFIARLVTDDSRSLEKNELGALSFQATSKEEILHGSQFSFIAICALDLTFIAPLTSEI